MLSDVFFVSVHTTSGASNTHEFIYSLSPQGRKNKTVAFKSFE
jgi:hypothetical protein